MLTTRELKSFHEAVTQLWDVGRIRILLEDIMSENKSDIAQTIIAQRAEQATQTHLQQQQSRAESSNEGRGRS